MSLRNPLPTALETYYLAVTTSPVAKLSPVLQGIAVQSTYASAVWLLAFNGTSVPTDGTVPIMAPIYVDAEATNVTLRFPTGLPISPNGLVLVASSSPDELTAVEAATLCISAFIDEYDPILLNHTTTGDLTTGVASKTVWNDASGPKKLKRVRAKNNNAAVRYLCLYAEDTPDSGSKIITACTIPGSSSIEWNFGVDGITPLQVDPDGTIHDACVILGQDSMDPADTASGTDFNIEATYI